MKEPGVLRFLRAMMQIIGCGLFVSAVTAVFWRSPSEGAAYALVGACLIVSSRFLGLPPEA